MRGNRVKVSPIFETATGLTCTVPVGAEVKPRSGSAPTTAVRVLALKIVVRCGVQRSA
jgi:hypothetical protein